MAEIIRLRGDPHDEAQLLLPWYVTGQMDPAGLARLERHLADCEACREDLAIERVLHRAVSDPEPVPDFVPALPQPYISDAPAATRRWAQLGRVAAAAVAFAILMPGSMPAPAPYHALGNSAPTGGNVLLMIEPDVDARALRTLLERDRARLVGGPTSAGAYVVEIAPAERSLALRRLRARPGVSLAEPLDVGSAQ